MGGHGSGGHNKLPIDIHVARGTFRPGRHGKPSAPSAVVPVSEADRRRVLRGLGPIGRRVAVDLLARCDGWNSSSLAMLRSYAESCARAQVLEAAALDPAAAPDLTVLHAELKINVALRKSLGLERL